MTRYFFDIRDGDELVPDEEGVDMPDVEAAQEEAAQTLADLARQKIRGLSFHHLAVEVRDLDGPVLEANFTWRSFSKH